MELSATAGSTTGSAGIDLVYATTGLGVGEYSAEVTVTSDNGDNSPQVLDVDLRITEVPDATINTSVSSLESFCF